MLEEIFDISLSNFKDDRKEDFLFEINGKVIIGEIKGKNEAVKNILLSQLNLHYLDYLDLHSEVTDDDIKRVLVTNHQRNKPLNKREVIHEDIIKRAKEQFSTLIIETSTLLKLYEKKIKNEVTTERCRELLDITGLLEDKDF